MILSCDDCGDLQDWKAPAPIKAERSQMEFLSLDSLATNDLSSKGSD
jgi:hypothetical protein